MLIGTILFLLMAELGTLLAGLKCSRSCKRLREQVEVLQKISSATNSVLERNKETTQALFDSLLAQIYATDILKDDKARLERELAMSEEQIHLLTPAPEKRKKKSLPRRSKKHRANA